MSAWEVVGCLLILRNEFNLVSPKRDKGADGTIGDTSHSSSSDHTPDEDSSVLRDHDADHKNEVHALDIDSSGPWPDGKRGDIKGSWFDKKIMSIIANQKARWLDPNDVCELHYIIWMGMIYSTSSDWEGRVYTGSSDKHTTHAHFSARYETKAENSKRSWGVYTPPKPAQQQEEIPVDQATFNKLMNGWATTPDGKKNIAAAVGSLIVPSKEVPQRNLIQGLGDLFGQLRPSLVFPMTHPENKTSGLPADAPIRKLLELPAKVDALKAEVDNLKQ